MEFFPTIKNTCSVTGEPLNGVWANNIDEARAGLGVSEAVAKGNSKPVQAEASNTPVETFDLEGASINEVLAAIDAGLTTREAALAFEEAKAKPRASLVKQLKG